MDTPLLPTIRPPGRRTTRPRRTPTSSGRATVRHSHRRSAIVAVVVDPLPLWLAERRDPTLAHTPLVVAHQERVQHANPLARRLGITPGMHLDGARLRAPGLVLAPSGEADLAQAWRQLAQELNGWTPWLDLGQRGRAWLRLNAGEAAMLAQHLRARVGVASDVQTAEIAALSTRVAEVQEVPDGQEAAFLDRLPLRFLRGVGLPERDLTRLRWLGLVTVADLARWTPVQLCAYLGDVARRLIPYLHGPRRRELGAWQPPLTLRRSLAFERPLFEPGELEPALDHLARSLALDLHGRTARHLTLSSEGRQGAVSASRISKRPLQQAGQIRQQALFALRDSGAAAAGVETLTLELADPHRHSEEAKLWDTREQRERSTDLVLERFPRSLVQVGWDDPHAPASDLTWHWVPLEDLPRGQAGSPITPAATSAARRALAPPLGALEPADHHATPVSLATPATRSVPEDLPLPTAAALFDEVLTPLPSPTGSARTLGPWPVSRAA